MGDKRCALVIDSTTLEITILKPKNKNLMLDLGMRYASVIFCRGSPKQKTEVTSSASQEETEDHGVSHC